MLYNQLNSKQQEIATVFLEQFSYCPSYPQLMEKYWLTKSSCQAYNPTKISVEVYYIIIGNYIFVNVSHDALLACSLGFDLGSTSHVYSICDQEINKFALELWVEGELEVDVEMGDEELHEPFHMRKTPSVQNKFKNETAETII